MKREINAGYGFRIQFLFAIILFLIIVILSSMIILLGKDIYNSINEDRQNNYDVRVSLSYLSNKIRQSDIGDEVELVDLYGQPSILIKENYGGTIYHTWIYYYDNSINEILVEENERFNLQDGMKIVEAEKLDITKLKDKLFKITVQQSGKNYELILSEYSEWEVKGEK